MIGGELLTERQLQVARLISDGLTNEEIAAKLSISERTVKKYSDEIRIRLKVPKKRNISGRMRELGLLEPPKRP